MTHITLEVIYGGTDNRIDLDLISVQLRSAAPKGLDVTLTGE